MSLLEQFSSLGTNELLAWMHHHEAVFQKWRANDFAV